MSRLRLGRNLTCSYLNSHHRQHLHRDPVKFVETAPRPCLSQAFVDVPAGLVDRDMRDRYSDGHSGTGSQSQSCWQVQTGPDWMIRHCRGGGSGGEADGGDVCQLDARYMKKHWAQLCPSAAPQQAESRRVITGGYKWGLTLIIQGVDGENKRG